MGCYLPKPNTETDLEDLDGCGLRTAAGAMQGWRVTQEDAHNVIVSQNKKIRAFNLSVARTDERHLAVRGLRWPRWP